MFGNVFTGLFSSGFKSLLERFDYKTEIKNHTPYIKDKIIEFIHNNISHVEGEQPCFMLITNKNKLWVLPGVLMQKENLNHFDQRTLLVDNMIYDSIDIELLLMKYVDTINIENLNLEELFNSFSEKQKKLC